MVKITKLYKSFGDRIILEDINLVLPDRGVIALVGTSGSGKTTLLNAIGGIDLDYSGKITISETNIANLSDDELADFRLHNIGYVFQNFNLLNLETVEMNVRLPLDSSVNAFGHVKKRRIDDVLSLVGMSKLKKKLVNTLSGGEKQRVAIAKALVNSPKLILCDEPTGALDSANANNVFSLLKSLSKTSLIVIATHDIDGVKKIADQLIEIKDGKISNIIIDKEKDLEVYSPPIIGKGIKLKKSALPISFQFNHAFNKIKSKRFRFLISNMMISLSLTGIGTSMIISNNVRDKINASFSSMINGNQILMTSKKDNLNTFDGVYSASEDQMNDLGIRYSKYVDGVGATYQVNFEDFFKDKNTVYIDTSPYKLDIQSLSMRNVNDFVWANDMDRTRISPTIEGEIENDQVILGLSFSDMSNICFQLKILRNFESLANYIYHNDLKVCFHVMNNSWQYEDEQMFKIVGIFEDRRTHFVHTNLLWNRVVFEDMMRFPNNDGVEIKLPWEMVKVCYFHTKEDPSALLNATLYDEYAYDYVFERTNNNYHPNLCKIGEVCSEKRVLVYFADKHAIRPNSLKILLSTMKDLNDYYFISDFGYASYASNLLSGFSKNLFVSLYQERIEAAIDADTMKGENNQLELKLPPGVVYGNYLNSIGDGLRFSSHPKTVLYGRLPANNDEIAISSGLALKLDNGYDVLDSNLLLASDISLSNGIDDIEKEYRIVKAKIVGIIDEEKPYLYHDQNWTISFFRDKIGMSSFYLTPKSIVFELDDNVDADVMVTKLNKMFKDYTFINPLSAVKESLETTLDYSETILLIFSLLSSLISILLLATIIILNVLESKEEVKILKYIGIRKNDINSSFVTEGMTHVIIAFFFSLLEMVGIDFILSHVLNGMLGTNVNYSLNIVPILTVFLIALITSFVLSELIVKILSISKKKA